MKYNYFQNAFFAILHISLNLVFTYFWKYKIQVVGLNEMYMLYVISFCLCNDNF